MIDSNKKCHSCDKPLSTEEVFENYDECHQCNIVRIAGRLVYHINKGRTTLMNVLNTINTERQKM